MPLPSITHKSQFSVAFTLLSHCYKKFWIHMYGLQCFWRNSFPEKNFHQYPLKGTSLGWLQYFSHKVSNWPTGLGCPQHQEKLSFKEAITSPFLADKTLEMISEFWSFTRVRMVITCAKFGFDWSRGFSQLTPEKWLLLLEAFIAHTALQSTDMQQCNTANNYLCSLPTG